MFHDDDGNSYTVNPIKVLLRHALEFLRDSIASDAMDAVRRARAITGYDGYLTLECGVHIERAAGRTDLEKLTNAWRSQRRLIKVPVVDDEWS